MIAFIFWHCSRSNLHPIQMGIYNPKQFADIAAACIAFNRTIHDFRCIKQQQYENGQISQQKMADAQTIFAGLMATYYRLY